VLLSLSGITPVHLAAGRGFDGAVLALLLARGGHEDATDERGFTPLIVACWRGNGEAANQLLSAGANPNAKESSRNGTIVLIAMNKQS